MSMASIIDVYNIREFPSPPRSSLQRSADPHLFRMCMEMNQRGRFYRTATRIVRLSFWGPAELTHLAYLECR